MSDPTVISATRIDQWWIPKATNLLVVLYASVMVSGLPPFPDALSLLVLSFLTILGIASFGHLLNDWNDIASDIRAGKRNRMAGLRPRARWLLLLAALAIGLLPWTVLPMTALSAQLLVLEFGLFVAYSVPPVRLKERGLWAALADGAYACAIPGVLASYTVFLSAGRTMTVALFAALFVWQLSLGVRHYLNHLAIDRGNDMASGTPTLATVRGNRFIHAVVRRLVLPLEFLAFIGFLLIVDRPVLLAAVVVAFLLLSAVNIVLTLGRKYPLIVYRFSTSNLDRVYQGFLPLALLVLLIVEDWRFTWLLLLHLLPYGISWYRSSGGSWRIADMPVINSVVGLPLTILRRVGAATGRIDGPVSKSPASERGPHDPAPVGRQSIAVANINKRKYTETFVNETVGRLDFDVHYIYGSELPRFDDDDRHFLSNWPSLQLLIRWLESALRLEKDRFLRSSIANYLQARRVQLVLAQFGPVGVEMLPITRDIGIPLIVNFHGYDVFHRELLERYADSYERLFREADRIIGVSDQMLQRLRELGAPPDKLVHLPAYVDLDRFPFVDRSATGPRFLAVGRFAETKSPHLTILAFQRVAEEIDDATLTLVGKGGGGELFEACVILVKALGLEDRVEFTGVLSHDRVAEEMCKARVFVQHSVTTPEQGDMEGKPVAIMEAMASGMPVVATRHSGIVELIDDGVNGLLVDEYDVQAMADRMLMLARDDEQAQRLGRNASRSIHEHPLVSNHLSILEGMIRDSIARN